METIYEKIRSLCSQHGARLDGSDVIPYGQRHSVVDAKGHVIYVNCYHSGKVHVDGRGFESELISALNNLGQQHRSPSSPPEYRSWIVNDTQLQSAGALLEANGGTASVDSWSGIGWVVHYYETTHRLLVQGKNTREIIEMLNSLLCPSDT